MDDSDAYAYPKAKVFCGGEPDRDREPVTREDFLNKIFKRDVATLFPNQRVFLPIWREAGQLQGVIRVDSSEIPQTTYRDGEMPVGEVIEDYPVSKGIVLKLELAAEEKQAAKPDKKAEAKKLAKGHKKAGKESKRKKR